MGHPRNVSLTAKQVRTCIAALDSYLHSGQAHADQRLEAAMKARTKMIDAATIMGVWDQPQESVPLIELPPDSHTNRKMTT